jgi:hypothetical protein
MKVDLGTGRAGISRDTAGTAATPKLTLPSGETITLTPEVVARLDSALRALRRPAASHRDLGAEIEALLSERPASSTIEIARTIRARDHDVRLTLNGDSRVEVALLGRKESSRATGRVAAGTRHEQRATDDGRTAGCAPFRNCFPRDGAARAAESALPVEASSS